VFIQITSDHQQDATIPGKAYSFGEFIAAQAQGDFQTLETRKRRVSRIHLGNQVTEDLHSLKKMIEKAHMEYLMNINHTE
jgi:hypothetical protein